MIKLKGQLLIFDRVDKCGRKFAKDCKISFPDKAIVLDDFQWDIPALGIADISEDDQGLNCKVMLYDTFDMRDEYHVGGFYSNVESHVEGLITVIDSCRLLSMSIVPDHEVADEKLKIRRIKKP